ncbi:unnamed protein product [Cylicocyclus nassatus]|uniref:Uncharacterized protein n=1 Tax=Cylicocyclus nassatus TaxID=53992 RepID=A0AA36H9E5_CYLNA|nr:unnamed protein product [Cylicocyclus nassatus]
MPEFHHKVETKHVLCDKVLSGDKAYIKKLTQNRSVLRNSTLDMSCKQIKARVLPPKVLKKMEFGVAYARVVHENYDMVIKTVYETASILKELGGANDICVRPCESDRWNQSFSWDARSLKLFRNETQASPKQLAAELPEIRGIVQSSLSRAAVDWAVRNVDLTTLIYQLNSDVRGIDETLWATLQMSDDLEMPGRFTGKCISGQTYVPCISRSELYSTHKTYTFQDSDA